MDSKKLVFYANNENTIRNANLMVLRIFRLWS